MTLDFYDQNARQFADRTRDYDVSFLYDRFLAYVPDGAHLLDAGCGSGRDALAFMQRGYHVTAIDGSAELAALAAEYIGAPVRHLRFDDMDYSAEFDAIWASATLLHVPRADLPAVFAKFIEALKTGGVWFMSFKVGQGEQQISDGRLFTYFEMSALKAFIDSFDALTILDLWQQADTRGAEFEDWVCAIVRKK